MRAIILAAGIGKRLTLGEHTRQPKCLLRFGGKSLLQRHLELLGGCGVTDIVIVTGYAADRIAEELATMDPCPPPTIIYNPDFDLGSVVSLWAAREHLTRGGEVLLMDADVLYDHRVLRRLTTSLYPNCFLIDRNFETGAEPVNLFIHEGTPVDLRKTVAPDLNYNYSGESVGFYRLSESIAGMLATLAVEFVNTGRRQEPHEEVLRDLLQANPRDTFGFEDITGVPWIEIDFPADLHRAEKQVFPRLMEA
jgi:choline kinase